jgi:hypothetical protein
MGAILDKVITPDVVRPFCSQADAGSIVEPQTTAFGLFGWHFRL